MCVFSVAFLLALLSFINTYPFVTSCTFWLRVGFVILILVVILGLSSGLIRVQIFAYGPRHSSTPGNAVDSSVPVPSVTDPPSSARPGRSSAIEGHSDPDIRQRPQAPNSDLPDEPQGQSPGEPQATKRWIEILEKMVSWTVPHSWFRHFYAFSVTASLAWGILIVFPALLRDASDRSGVLSVLCAVQARQPLSSGTGMSPEGMLLAWSLVLFQGVRRLLECNAMDRARADYERRNGSDSTRAESRMPGVHWLAALGYYGLLSAAVWAEGLDNVCASPSRPEITGVSIMWAIYHRLGAIALFFAASLAQNVAHRYLVSLRYPADAGEGTAPARSQAYKFPSHPLFNYTLTPHYFAEVVLYLALARAATAGSGEVVNTTLMFAFGFVFSNLAVTAMGTREWYIRRFGAETVGARARMIPGVW